jgi:Arylsulfotransferase (ASST)
MHKGLLYGAVLVVLTCVTTVSIASQRILAEQSAYGAAPAVDQCVPKSLNVSDLLPNTSLEVSPLPGAYDASPYTQISLVGAPVGELSLSVSGSRTGNHPGRLVGYSQGDGASFLPVHPFLPGETVTVKGSVSANGKKQAFTFDFLVAHPDTHLYRGTPTKPSTDTAVTQHFYSAPTLTPPRITVDAHTSEASHGDIFMAPYNGPGPSGPMIFDEEGNLVWFDPLPHEVYATNLQVQQHGPERVLTWWQGHIPPQGFGEGEEIIDNSSYQRIATVHAGNGFKADLHEFEITPRGTAILTVFEPVECNLSSVGGPRHSAVTDSAFQEIDLATGLVRREWSALDHVGLADSYSTATGSSDEWPFDYFHMNSFDPESDGRTLISARNTWSMYELDTASGQVLARIGGKRSDFKLASGAATAFQHDASVLSNGTISVFDNGGVPKVHPQSRALLLSVNPKTMTDSVLTEFEHASPPLSSGSQGNVEALEDGDFFIGWGSEPYFSEYSATGQLLFDSRMPAPFQSYRGYRFSWTGTPTQPPAAAAVRSGSALTVYASWNGDNRTVSWRLLAGPQTTELLAVGGATRTGFETAIAAPSNATYVAVQSLGANGEVLGTSAPVKT